MENDSRNQVSWNIASQTAFQLANTLNEAFNLFNSGEIKRSYHSFKRMRNQFINHEIKKPERELLQKIQDAIEKNYKEYIYHTRLKNIKVALTYQLKYYSYIELYSRAIVFFLKRIGYLPNKENRARVSF